jgi:hypothetical protein
VQIAGIDVLGMLSRNWELTLGGVVLLALAIWTFQEREEGDSAGETVDSVGSRAEGAAGGILSGTRALLLSLLAIVGTVVAEVMQLFNDLGSLIDTAPLLAGHLAYGLLSVFGVELGIPRERLGIAFLGITVIALIWGVAEARSRRRSFA